jgi:hypothetical protein
MNKTHFEAIARVIKVEQESYTNESCRDAIEDVAIRLASDFNQINPRFNKKIFLTACGF